MKKIGKPAMDIAQFKQSFFKENEKLVKHNIRISKLYREQPKREVCKNCGTPLGKVFFTKQDIDYYYCDNCHHLNGGHQETVEFAKELYLDSDYAVNYNENYIDAYIQRAKKIYLPKAEFLLQSLDEMGLDAKNLSFSDFGCGSGYFVYALAEELGCNAVEGYEISKEQCDYANKMIGKDLVNNIDINGLINVIKESNSDVVSFIGVLEHVLNPSEVLQAIKDNENIKYCYISVPMFSFSTFFEMINQANYNRNLGDAHTHLYTNDSIDWMCNKYDFEIASKWLFGTDIMDLYRFMSVKMEKLAVNEEFMNFFKTKYLAVIDKLQLVIDENEFCSELHFLIKKNK